MVAALVMACSTCLNASQRFCAPCVLGRDRKCRRCRAAACWWVKFVAAIGTRIDETGTLLRDGGGFVLRRDLGGRWKLDMHRVPVDHIEKRVRITGIVVSDELVDVDSVAPERLRDRHEPR